MRVRDRTAEGARLRDALDETLYCRYDPHHPEHCPTLAALDSLIEHHRAASAFEALEAVRSLAWEQYPGDGMRGVRLEAVYTGLHDALAAASERLAESR